MKKQIDPYSGESFYPKRSNQRFSSRTNQIAYNNAKAKKERDQHTFYDNQIKKNWKILISALKDKKNTVQTKDYLLGRGYDFRFLNNLRIQDKTSYFGLYDCGIRLTENDKYEIIKFNYE